MENKLIHHNDDFLECEQKYVFVILMFVAGFYGAFTYNLRGGVFCNAQTANFVLFAMAFGKKQWADVCYLIIPISAYFMGTVISEVTAGPVRKHSLIRWDTMLIFIEIVVVIILGFVPESAPFQISQVTINFIASMQYNTFRQAEKMPMATTFCTSHVRQIGVSTVKMLKNKDKKSRQTLLSHLVMLGAFVVGAVVSTVLCNKFLGKAIWFTLIPLGYLFIDLLYADLKKERKDHNKIPHGH